MIRYVQVLYWRMAESCSVLVLRAVASVCMVALPAADRSLLCTAPRRWQVVLDLSRAASLSGAG